MIQKAIPVRSPAVVAQSPGVTWTLQNTPDTVNQRWESLAYGNGVWVSLDAFGIAPLSNQAMTSPDGVIWTHRAIPVAGGYQAVHYANGLFVAIGYKIITSTDGVNWTEQTEPSSFTMYGLTYGNGLWVAVGRDDFEAGNCIVTSTDAVTWTLRTASSAGWWTNVDYGNGVFVAIKEDGSTMTSGDGLTWSAGTTLTGSSSWYALIFAKSQFVAISADGNVATSIDGVNWNIIDALDDVVWANIAYGAGLYVVIAEQSGGTQQIATSRDAITWNRRNTPGTDKAWAEIGFADGKFVAVGFGADFGHKAMTSP